jgi:hypothetical protein
MNSARSYKSDKFAPPVFRVYSYRWLIVLFYGLGCVSQGFLMVGFSPISKNIAEAYKIEQFYIDTCVILFLIMYIPGNFISVYCLDKFGIGLSIFCGGFLTMFGAWIRYTSILL